MDNKRDVKSAHPALEAPRFGLVPIKGALEADEHLPEGAEVTISFFSTLGIENTLAPADELTGRGFRVVPHLPARLMTGTRHLDKLLRRRPRKRCVNAIKPMQLGGSS